LRIPRPKNIEKTVTNQTEERYWLTVFVMGSPYQPGRSGTPRSMKAPLLAPITSQKFPNTATQHESVDNSPTTLFGTLPFSVALENAHFCLDQRGDEFLT
jgi:uncharacterized membrane protein